jgi:hypothetical protein
MSFDFAATEHQLLERLAPLATAAGIPLYGDDSTVDLTDSASVPVGAQLVFLDFYPDDQVGGASKHFALFAFDLYVDPPRLSSAQSAAASALFASALSALIGWEFAPGRRVRAEKVQRCGVDGRIRRRSFGFTIPAYVAGS